METNGRRIDRLSPVLISPARCRLTHSVEMVLSEYPERRALLLAKVKVLNLKESRGHGGHRAGAGRKPLEPGGTVVVNIDKTTATITRRQNALVQQWMETHSCPSFTFALNQIVGTVTQEPVTEWAAKNGFLSTSEALRAIIDQAT
jgi:hypothetical protein